MKSRTSRAEKNAENRSHMWAERAAKIIPDVTSAFADRFQRIVFVSPPTSALSRRTTIAFCAHALAYVYCCSTCTSLQLLCCIHIFVFSFIYRCNIAVILSSKSHFPMSYVCVCLCLLEKIV